MSEDAVSQGLIPVTATIPGEGIIASGQLARKTVSADSFRKLTLLLKKKDAFPLPEVAPLVVEPQFTEALPDIIEEQIYAASPEIMDTGIVDVWHSSFAEVSDPEPANEPLAPPADMAELQPEIIENPEPITEMIAEEQFVAEPPHIPEPAVQIEPPAPTLKPPSSILRQRPRDAFAVSPSALPEKKPAVIAPVIQTHAQEQEAAELARSLLDMMASGASSGQPQERALAADTLLRMLPRLPLKSMIMLAERLCMMDVPPHLLVAKLICDPRIEVAGPLLEECMHLTDEDLALVIHEGSPAKRRMMARRRRISRAITSQLVQTRDASVLLTLVRNMNAEIPHESYVDLVSVAMQQPELLTPLCTRSDLPVPLAFELFWQAPAQLRRYLLSRFLTDSETLTKILKIARETNGEDNAKIEFPDPEHIKNALQLMADGKYDEAAAALAGCSRINAVTAGRILNDRQGEPLAALFKAVGVPRAIVSEIFASIRQSESGIIDPARDIEDLKALFDSLSFNKARILLTYWDWSTLKTGPYAPLN